MKINLDQRSLVIETPEGHAFEISADKGQLIVKGVSGLVSSGGLFDYSVKITHMAQFEKGLTPDQIRDKIAPPDLLTEEEGKRQLKEAVIRALHPTTNEYIEDKLTRILYDFCNVRVVSKLQQARPQPEQVRGRR